MTLSSPSSMSPTRPCKSTLPSRSSNLRRELESRFERSYPRRPSGLEAGRLKRQIAPLFCSYPRVLGRDSIDLVRLQEHRLFQRCEELLIGLRISDGLLVHLRVGAHDRLRLAPRADRHRDPQRVVVQLGAADRSQVAVGFIQN